MRRPGLHSAARIALCAAVLGCGPRVDTAPTGTRAPASTPAAAPTAAATLTSARSAEAESYLQEVLDYIRVNSVRSAQLNWDFLLQQVGSRAITAQTTADTYPAIRYAVQLLGDRHSSFRDPEQARQIREGLTAGTGVFLSDRVIVEVTPGSPAAEAGLRAGDVIETVNGTAVRTPSAEQRAAIAAGNPVRLEVSRAGDVRLEATLRAATFSVNRMPVGRRLDGNIGYVELPTLSCAGQVCQPYADATHAVLRSVDSAPTCGWIVDLRRNRGGNMWPMLAGIGPVLGEGAAGGFARPGGPVTPYGYRDGGSFSGENRIGGAEQPYILKQANPPVAVLTSAFTASSGEFTLLAFRGRPETRTFGQPTAGLPTSNVTKELRDGAVLYLTSALGVDRTGKTYDAAIAPDELVPLDWTQIESSQDPALGSAAAWLRTKGCA